VTGLRLVPGPRPGPSAQSLGLFSQLDPTSIQLSVVQFVQRVLHVRPGNKMKSFMQALRDKMYSVQVTYVDMSAVK